jgi:dipeptidyl aminopeptidase/acylaminoacyl peptidase
VSYEIVLLSCRKGVSVVKRKKLIPVFIGGVLCLNGMVSWAQQTRRPFTVADEIGLTLFGDANGAASEVLFSPDGNYFVVYSERGHLDLNRVEDSLRFYRSEDVEDFLKRPDGSQLPSPVWVVNRSEKQGPIISDWRWLADSSGVAFLERRGDDSRRLVVADVGRRAVEPLTAVMETVIDFDIRDQRHYVYTSPSRTPKRKASDEHQVAIVGTGRDIWQLLSPDSSKLALFGNRNYLWAVMDGRRFQVTHAGEPIAPDEGLALAPDGSSLVTKLLSPEVPSSWETLYPPPYASDPHRVQAGKQLHQYYLIDLQTGSVRDLTGAPVSNEAGLWSDVVAGPSWSNDGQAILLPGTFLNSRDHTPSRPCIAVVDLPSYTYSCTEALKGHTGTGVEEGYHMIRGVRFVDGDKQRVMVISINRTDSSLGTTEYLRMADGTWQPATQSKGLPEVWHEGLRVIVEQGLNEPPLLVAINKETVRVIWDPNPQLKNFELGEARVYTWRSKEGRDWRGALYKPSNFKPGKRYPLVIQTHGFGDATRGFRPSGIYPAGFAARALAAAGILVLQVDEHCPMLTPDEGPCAASGYEAAANQMVSEGLVDPERIGIIGFSRTCFYVMETLTTVSIHLKAASITDGVMEDYFQYMLRPELLAQESNPMIGGPPFGKGLQQWLKLSPGFNLDKITTPLLVVAEGSDSLLTMWEPYAGLHYLHKPVDLMKLNTDEHILTNPAVRLASQGGSVDWFRFWLQEYEDPAPAKAEQYKRWRELRKLQETNARNATEPQAASN